MTVSSERVVASQRHVVDIFRAFRQRLLDQYGTIEYQLKSDHSQVTELDVLIEQTLRDEMNRAFPEFAFAGEETGEAAIHGDRPYWIVDPIDGTSSYIRGLPNCTNMAALVVNGQPIAAVVYDFINDLLYTARAGEGAYRNGERLAISQRQLDASAMYVDSPLVSAELRQLLRDNHVSAYRPFGASGHAYRLVAEGKLEAYNLFNSRASVHDNAPGVLLVQEAGGEIVTKDDAPWSVTTKDFIVGTPMVVSFWREHDITRHYR